MYFENALLWSILAPGACCISRMHVLNGTAVQTGKIMCSPPDWEGSCSSCSSTNSGAAGSGTQQREDDWPDEPEDWSYCKPPTHCHLQKHSVNTKRQEQEQTSSIPHLEDETNLVSWALHSSGHTLWPLCLWGTLVGICFWNKHGRPPAQQDNAKVYTLQGTPGIFDILVDVMVIKCRN